MATEKPKADRPASWSDFRKLSPHAALIPFLYSEWLASWAVYFLSRWTLLQALEYAGNLSILVAVIFYFADAGDRTQAMHYQAWQVINTAQGKGGSGGRIEALEQLNDDHIPLVGVDVSDAFLQGVRLESAQLRRGNFNGVDLRDAHLQKADLDNAEMKYANARGADLRRTNLTGADLTNADLNGVTLVGANLTDAVLDKADLRGADIAKISWDRISMNGTQIGGAKNPPEGFLAWALNHGAVNQSTTQP